jgi:hypothetical protein
MVGCLVMRGKGTHVCTSICIMRIPIFGVSEVLAYIELIYASIKRIIIVHIKLCTFEEICGKTLYSKIPGPTPMVLCQNACKCAPPFQRHLVFFQVQA